MITCPTCHNKLVIDISVKDHFLTKEEFSIYKCDNCLNKYTQPIPNNIEKYYNSDTYISHNANNKSIKTILYKMVRNYMLTYKYKKLFKFLNKKQILDYGSGNGHFVKYLTNMKESAWGYDINQYAIKNIDKTTKKQIFTNKKEAFKKTYDTITLWHVLEHIKNPTEFINELSTIISSKGYLIVAIPNHLSYDAQKYNHYWAGYDAPRHITHFSNKGIKMQFEKLNYLYINTLPLYFDAFYVSLLSEQYKKSKYTWTKAVYNGFLSNFKAHKTKEYSSNIFIFRKNE